MGRNIISVEKVRKSTIKRIKNRVTTGFTGFTQTLDHFDKQTYVCEREYP